MNSFEIQDGITRDMLKKKGIVIVHKVTRSGCTMSLVKGCCQLRRKVVVFCPTVKIIREIERKIPEILGYNPKIAPHSFKS